MDVNLKTTGLIDIIIKPNEIFLGERGSMAFCDGGIDMIPIDKNLILSIKRWLSGESILPIVQFTNRSNSTKQLKLRYDKSSSGWFDPNTTSTDIHIIDLSKVKGGLVIKSGAFFCSTSGVKIEVFTDKNLARSIFGFGSIFKQKISGNGTVFLQKNRWLQLDMIELEQDKSITIDPKEVYAYSLDSLQKSEGFSFNNFIVGEGFSSYNFKGPASIYIYKNKPTDYSEFNLPSIMRTVLIYYIIFLIIKAIL